MRLENLSDYRNPNRHIFEATIVLDNLNETYLN